MTISFDDNGRHLALAPLTLTRAVCELRIGILTIKESWLKYLSHDEKVGYLTEDYLSEKYPKLDSDLIISGNIKPSAQLAFKRYRIIQR